MDNYLNCQKPQRGIGAVAVRVVYVYCHGYYGVQGYSDRGVLVQWQYAWCTRTATVTVEYRDTLTEGYWCSGSTRGVRVLPRLLCICNRVRDGLAEATESDGKIS